MERSIMSKKKKRIKTGMDVGSYYRYDNSYENLSPFDVLLIRVINSLI